MKFSLFPSSFSTSTFAVVVVGYTFYYLSSSSSSSSFFFVNAQDAEKCDCKSVGDSFLVTRLWNITDPTLTDQDVIDEFDRGFSNQVRNLIGFQEYISATTNIDNTVFFMNIFSTGATAVIAQEAAASFASNSELLNNGAIIPKEFTGSDIDFHFSSTDCITKSIAGKYLSTRLWKLTDTSNITIQDVVTEFEIGYAPIIQMAEGFIEYGGCRVPGTAKTFFYNVFETKEGALKANQGATDFVQNGKLSGQIEKVVFTEGVIDFDYTCVDPPKNNDAANSGVGGSNNNNIRSTTQTTVIIIMTMMLGVLGMTNTMLDMY